MPVRGPGLGGAAGALPGGAVAGAAAPFALGLACGAPPGAAGCGAAISGGTVFATPGVVGNRSG